MLGVAEPLPAASSEVRLEGIGVCVCMCYMDGCDKRQTAGTRSCSCAGIVISFSISHRERMQNHPFMRLVVGNI